MSDKSNPEKNLTNFWLRVLQSFTLSFWGAMIFYFGGLLVGLPENIVYTVYTVFVLPIILFGFLSLIAYSGDAKYIKQNSEESPPGWVKWTILHLLIGIISAPVYLYYRGKRFDNDWKGLIPNRIKKMTVS